MCHYANHPTHHQFVCGSLVDNLPTAAELDPRKTSCERCRATLAWRVDSEDQYILGIIDAGAADAQEIVESARIILAAALNIIERLRRCNQIIQDQRGHISRIKAGR